MSRRIYTAIFILAGFSLAMVTEAHALRLCQQKNRRPVNNASTRVQSLRLIADDSVCSKKERDLGLVADYKKVQELALQVFDANSLNLQGQGGAQGPQGEPGIQGAIGPQGLQGPQGEQGIKGASGAAGDQGIRGEVGPQGVAGPQGTQGIQGLMGPRGLQGAQGNSGIVNVDACYTLSAKREGIYAQTEELKCSNPDSEFLMNSEYELSDEYAFVSKSKLIFNTERSNVHYPIGISIRANHIKTGARYAMMVSVVCCPKKE